MLKKHETQKFQGQPVTSYTRILRHGEFLAEIPLKKQSINVNPTPQMLYPYYADKDFTISLF